MEPLPEGGAPPPPVRMRHLPPRRSPAHAQCGSGPAGPAVPSTGPAPPPAPGTPGDPPPLPPRTALSQRTALLFYSPLSPLTTPAIPVRPRHRPPSGSSSGVPFPRPGCAGAASRAQRRCSWQSRSGSRESSRARPSRRHRRPLGEERRLSPGSARENPPTHSPPPGPRGSPAIQDQPAPLLQRLRLPRRPERGLQAEVGGEVPPALCARGGSSLPAGRYRPVGVGSTRAAPHLVCNPLVCAQPQDQHLLQPAGMGRAGGAARPGRGHRTHTHTETPTHCSSGLSTTLRLVPCPRLCTSRIQASGSSVWTRASRLWLPSPRGTNRPCAPMMADGGGHTQRGAGDTHGHACHPPPNPSPWLTWSHADVLLNSPV